jgi:hypothetical protein
MFSSKMYIYTNKPSKDLFTLTKLLMTDEVTRIDGFYYYLVVRFILKWTGSLLPMESVDVFVVEVEVHREMMPAPTVI